jgi:histidinol dehydrogenase
MRRYTVQELSASGLQNIGQAIIDLANAEGLDAHSQAVALRLEELAGKAQQDTEQALNSGAKQ